MRPRSAALRLPRLLLAAALLAAFSLAVVPGARADAAAPARWQLDPPHTAVMFFVRHIFAQVPGTFDRFSSDIRFDPAAPQEGSVRVEIETASVNTRVAERDEHLRSPDFFDVARFPQIVFESETIEQTGENAFVAVGTLRIKDVTRKVRLPFTWLGEKANPANPAQNVAGIRGALTIDRLSFGVGEAKWTDMGMLGREVEIRIEAELIGPAR